MTRYTCICYKLLTVVHINSITTISISYRGLVHFKTPSTLTKVLPPRPTGHHMYDYIASGSSGFTLNRSNSACITFYVCLEILVFWERCY
jgi:hypothetical protein